LLRKPYVPLSTYRLQLNRQFTFSRAAELVGYLADLGVDAVYCSPYLQAAAGSMHGYDIADPTRLNAEIGSEADYEALCSVLQERGLGHILDIVPNHMGIAGNSNSWWQDVLENGPSSAYARVFDIDWNPVKPELKNKVLLPVLGNLYGKLLEAGEISLQYEKGTIFVRYWDHRFPVDPRSLPRLFDKRLGELPSLLSEAGSLQEDFVRALAALGNLPAYDELDTESVARRRSGKQPAKKAFRELAEKSPVLLGWIKDCLARVSGVPGRPGAFDGLHEFLERQPYRLSYWQAASDEVNYRRFFDINTLAAIRIEDDQVFTLHHELIFRLVREGRIQGVRVDHPDGLYDPPGYFERLQRRCRQESGAGGPFYVVAEKILDRKEELPRNWQVNGTVGYGFLNALNGLFVERSKETEFDKVYIASIGHAIDYERLIYDKKKFFALVNMASETTMLAHHLDRISEQDRTWRDLTHNHLALAIREVLACFPVYRTYISPGDSSISESDSRYIRTAIGKARDRLPALQPAVFDFLESVLLVRPGEGPGADSRRLYRDFTLRFQQISGPIMAKGVEDTAFYVYNRLLSLNEVGGDPMRFGWERTDFHAYLQSRRENWPTAMTSTSTHDTKRSEDVRMRINVLSEIPLEWQSRLAEWSEINAPHKTAIDHVLEPRPNTEYFVYQTLLGIWPNKPLDAAGRAGLLGRVWEAVLKSSREAKIYTNWSHPDAEYEEALRKFVSGVVASEKFMASFLPFQEKIAHAGMLNSLSALTLKMAAPGMPDTYQGNELWDYSLVDPDNRRRVDFDLRIRCLKSLDEMEAAAGPTVPMVRSLAESWRDGRIKMHVLRVGLRLRRRERETFLDGDYRPLDVEGFQQRNVVAFMRVQGGRRILAAGGRFFANVFSGRAAAAEKSPWDKTVIVLPDDVACAGPWRNVLTGELLESVLDGKKRVLEVPRVFGTLSAALLVNDAG